MNRAVLLALLLSMGVNAQSLTQAQSSMIVPSGSSIQGVAGTASAIDYTVDCVEQLNSTQTGKQCGQGQLGTSAASMYAPTTGFTGFILRISLTNDTGSPVTGVTLYKGGTGAANTIYGTISIASHNRCTWTAGHDWLCTDASGAALSSSSGGSSVIGGTGINITGGNTINLNVPVLTSSGGSGATSFTAHGLLIGEGTAAFGQIGLGTTTTVLHGNSSGDPTYASVVNSDLNLSVATCTNQFVTALSATGVPTCTTDVLASAQHANQGTATTLLHGNGSGNPSFASVVDADFSSTLGLAHGGTNANLSATGGTSQVLKQVSSGAAITVGQLACSDLSTASTGCSTTVGSSATKNTGTSVVDPGTGALEVSVPVTTVSATASKTYAATDRGKFFLRSDAGSAMTDTLPAPATATNGYTLTVYNVDATATDTVSTPSGVIGNGGGSTFALLAGRRTQFVSDGTNYYFVANNNNLLKSTGAITAGHLATFSDTTGVLVQDGGAPAVGSVTSVGVTVPAFLSVSGVPITGSGTAAITLSGTALPAANGGTGQTSVSSAFASFFQSIATTVGDLVYGGASGTPTRLAGNATTTKEYLFESGNGSAVTSEGWAQIVFGDLGGFVVCGQLPALTGGVTSSAGSCSTTVATNANLTGPVTSVGNATAVTSGAITNTMLATMNANTVKANITAGTASPTDVTLSSFKTWLAIVSTDISDFAAAVRATVLTGLNTATGAVVTAADSVLTAIGKLQWQITASQGSYNALYSFNIVGDQKAAYEITSSGTQVVATSGSATINCPNSCAATPFASSDVGKRITIRGAGTNGATYVGTISVFNSTTSVNVSPNPGTTVTATTSVPYAVQWGTDNTTGCNLMVSTINALTYPGAKVTFPAAGIFAPNTTGRYACPVTLSFTKSAILEGQGAGINQDLGDYVKSGGTFLVWWGTDGDGGTAFQGFLQWSAVTAGNQPIPGVGLHDISVDCRNGDQNSCATAIQFTDVVGFDLRSVFVMDALNAFDFATANMGGVTASTSRGIISNVGARQLDGTNLPQSNVSTATNLTPTTIAAGSTGQVMTAAGSQSIIVAAANGFFTPGYFWFTGTNGSVYYTKCTGGGGTTTLTGCGVSTDAATENPTLVTGANIVQASPNNGACMLLEGTSTTNTNLFTLTQARWSTGVNYGPACFELHNSDSNVVQQSVINGGVATNDGAINRIRRAGIRFGGNTVSSTLASRNNHFYDGDPGAGGVVALGVTNAGALLAAASGPNYYDRMQQGNGAPVPVVEAVTATATQAPVGGIFEWTSNGAFTQEFASGRPSVLTPSNSLASTAATDVVIPGCLIKNPPQWAQAGAQIQFRIGMTKTAAGTDTQLFKIFYGTSGAVGTDTATLATTAGAVATAAIDAQEITLNLLLPSTGGSVTPTGMALRTGKNAAVGAGYGAMSATAPTMTAINTGTAQTFIYPAIRTSATGETNLIVSCEAKVIQAAAQ